MCIYYFQIKNYLLCTLTCRTPCISQKDKIFNIYHYKNVKTKRAKSKPLPLDVLCFESAGMYLDNLTEGKGRNPPARGITSMVTL